MARAQADHRPFRAALYFAWVQVPISVLFGMLVYALAAHGDPRNSHWWALTAALCLILPPTLGFSLVSKLTSPRSARIFRERERWFPTTSGFVFCALTLAGAVEGSTDVVGRWVGAKLQYALMPTSAFVWAVVGTLLVVIVDRLLGLRQRASA